MRRPFAQARTQERAVCTISLAAIGSARCTRSRDRVFAKDPRAPRTGLRMKPTFSWGTGQHRRAILAKWRRRAPIQEGLRWPGRRFASLHPALRRGQKHQGSGGRDVSAPEYEEGASLESRRLQRQVLGLLCGGRKDTTIFSPKHHPVKRAARESSGHRGKMVWVKHGT